MVESCTTPLCKHRCYVCLFFTSAFCTRAFFSYFINWEVTKARRSLALQCAATERQQLRRGPSARGCTAAHSPRGSTGSRIPAPARTRAGISVPAQHSAARPALLGTAARPHAQPWRSGAGLSRAFPGTRTPVTAQQLSRPLPPRPSPGCHPAALHSLPAPSPYTHPRAADGAELRLGGASSSRPFSRPSLLLPRRGPPPAAGTTSAGRLFARPPLPSHARRPRDARLAAAAVSRCPASRARREAGGQRGAARSRGGTGRLCVRRTAAAPRIAVSLPSARSGEAGGCRRWD